MSQLQAISSHKSQKVGGVGPPQNMKNLIRFKHRVRYVWLRVNQWSESSLSSEYMLLVSKWCLNWCRTECEPSGFIKTQQRRKGS